MWHVVLSSLTSNQTRAPCTGNSLSHWTTREVLQVTTLTAPNSQQWMSQSREENERLMGRVSLYFSYPLIGKLTPLCDLQRSFRCEKKKQNPPICIFCLLQRRANEVCVRKSFLTCKLWENKWEKIAALSLVEDFFNDAKRFQKFPGLNPTLAPSCLLHLSTHSTMYTEGLLCARPCTRCWQ